MAEKPKIFTKIFHRTSKWTYRPPISSDTGGDTGGTGGTGGTDGGTNGLHLYNISCYFSILNYTEYITFYSDKDIASGTYTKAQLFTALQKEDSYYLPATGFNLYSSQPNIISTLFIDNSDSKIKYFFFNESMGKLSELSGSNWVLTKVF